jgi:4-aminobutyrate aminotransferase-like enzyme
MSTPLDSACAGPTELLAMKSLHLMPCTYHFYRDPPHIVAADGARLIDHAGREYVDCLSGVGVMNAGHGNPAIIEPAIEQMRTLQHTTSIYLTEPALRLAEALADIVPVHDPRFFFCVTGSEAVEFALLAATVHSRRPLIVATHGSLHGRTHWAMSATGLPIWRCDPFLMDDRVLRVPFNDASAVERAFECNPGQIAAFIAEPIQGNGGINVPDDSYWPAVRDACDAHGVALVLDEVQTGFNRTGRWFACQHWEVTPDIIAMGKGLGNGFPIAAVAARQEIAASFVKPAASTHGGNPVSASAALATVAYHRAQNLGTGATIRGEQLISGLRAATAHAPDGFDPPRGCGLMVGLPIVDRGRPSPQRCDTLLEGLKDRGVLAGKTGAQRHILALLPPLTITHAQIDTVCAAIGDLVSSHGC